MLAMLLLDSRIVKNYIINVVLKSKDFKIAIFNFSVLKEEPEWIMLISMQNPFSFLVT